MTVLEWLNRFSYVCGAPLSALWGHPIRFTSTRAIFYWFENYLQQPVPTSLQQIVLIIILSIYISICIDLEDPLVFGIFCLFVCISHIKVAAYNLVCNHADLFSQWIYSISQFLIPIVPLMAPSSKPVTVHWFHWAVCTWLICWPHNYLLISVFNILPNQKEPRAALSTLTHRLTC